MSALLTALAVSLGIPSITPAIPSVKERVETSLLFLLWRGRPLSYQLKVVVHRSEANWVDGIDISAVDHGQRAAVVTTFVITSYYSMHPRCLLHCATSIPFILHLPNLREFCVPLYCHILRLSALYGSGAFLLRLGDAKRDVYPLALVILILSSDEILGALRAVRLLDDGYPLAEGVIVDALGILL